MDSSSNFTSDYLQSRLRERKAESARVIHSQRHPTQGRDDVIFDQASQSPPKRKLADRTYQSSPVTGNFSQLSSHTRRTSNLGLNANSSARTMCAREMEEHVDKLSKQNFDLKLEVYHRREKIDELEKRLQDMPQLEEDKAELIDVNDELLLELEKRDKAIDEAVVMICELEDTVRSLREELDFVRPATPRQSKDPRPAAPRTPSYHHRRGSANPIAEHPSRKAVSPIVSARMTELAASGHPFRQLPSFIDTNDANTDALRSVFMDGNRPIRLIPSHASLLSSDNANDLDNAIDDIPQSPGLSVLSDSDLKSLYGKQFDHHHIRPQQPKQLQNSEQAIESTASSSSRGRFARTNRWVEDRAVSPSQSRKTKRSASHGSTTFQSMGDVLQPMPTARLELPMRVVRQRSPISQPVKEKEPFFINNSIFGQNVLPPTPDTMLTRPSNASSSSIIHRNISDSSIIHEKSLLDSTPHPIKGLSSLIPMTEHDHFMNPQAQFQHNSRSAFLSDDADPYDSASEDEATHGFGASLFQSQDYIQDNSRPYTASDKQYPASTMTGSTMYDTDGMQDIAPTRISPNLPRVFNSRRKSIELQNKVPITRPTQNFQRVQTEPRPPPSMLRRSSISSVTLSQTPSSTNDHFTTRKPRPLSGTASDFMATAPHINTSRMTLRNAQSDQTRHVRAVISPATPPLIADLLTSDATQTSLTDKPLPVHPSRVANLRQRVARLARRNSGSTGTTADIITKNNDLPLSMTSTATITPSLPPSIPNASNPPSSSITRKLFQRRRSSSSSVQRKILTRSANTPTSPTQHSPRRQSQFRKDTDDIDKTASAGRTAFMNAATAAAPFLDFEGNKPRDGGMDGPLFPNDM